MVYTRERLGELLVRAGLVTPEQLDSALATQRHDGGKVGEILVHELVVTEDQIAVALAEQKGLEHVNLASYSIDRTAVTQLPERIARLRGAIPIEFRDGSLVLAMADPLDIETIDDAQLRTGYPVIPVVAAPTQIRYAIDKYLAEADAFYELKEAEAKVEEKEAEEEAAESDNAVAVVRIVNQFIREAVRDGASDIHLEPRKDGLRVRMRVDGVLRDISLLPPSSMAGVISRVKIMAEMDIAEKRLPQDGRIQVRVDERPVDLRVATLPTPRGECVVIRVLNSGIAFKALEEIGMDPSDLDKITKLLAKPYGAILLAGPTGSGKSTTLYAALNVVNRPEVKIITVEDPIEYQMAGITQVGINPKIGLTFAAGLRTILRSDPDVVMVGEIRDPETAEIAVRSALTGHLVLSSIHTNDAPSALTRLADMDVPSYITSSAILGIIAQRLVRKLCPDCKRLLKPSKEALLGAGFSEGELKTVKVYGPVGCEDCHRTGYKGRVGLFEIMVVDEEITEAFLQHAPSEALREIALCRGMRALRRDGLDKVAAGVTSLEELNRVAY